MAYIYFNNVYPNVYPVYVVPRRYSIERDPVLLLIEEVIDYSLRRHNLHNWIPPVNLQVARLMNEIEYFDTNFAEAVIRSDTEEQAKQLAYGRGFDEEKWLEFTEHEKAIHYQECYLSYIYYFKKPYLFQMFSFACYACRIALQSNRHSLISDAVWALHAVLREILPDEEYYKAFYIVSNEYNNYIDNQLHDVDEGIVDEDSVSSLSLGRVGSNILFVEELIDYSLRYDNLHGWIPPIDLKTLRRTEMSYFTKNLGRAINRFIMETDVVDVVQQWGFNADMWLEIYRPSEASSFLYYFFRQLLHCNHESLMFFRLFSFACYCSKLAMRRNRNSLVNEVVAELVHLLRLYYLRREHYRVFDDWAREYNNLQLHTSSDDDGIGNEENI